MTAPGDSVLLLVLLAVFAACTGYAAGRLHQRYQTSQERQDAYLDGYESGTSSVFSAAVRMLGPRRPVRASAPVQPEEPESALGFPVPPPPPPYAVTEPGAVGGLVYRPFPDPRPADGAAPAMGEAPTHPHERARFVDRSMFALSEDRPAAENVSDEGRHTVPDELVQAPTYRLPPDRVFRARVPDGKRLPEEPTTRLPAARRRRQVPKPRKS